jgi:hypothetical protein
MRRAIAVGAFMAVTHMLAFSIGRWSVVPLRLQTSEGPKPVVADLWCRDVKRETWVPCINQDTEIVMGAGGRVAWREPTYRHWVGARCEP